MDTATYYEREDMEKDIDTILSRAMMLKEHGDVKELVYLQASLEQTSETVQRMVIKLVIEG